VKTIGETIAVLRKKHNMTQEALASEIGVSAQSVSKWESNTNMPDIRLMPAIADVFGVSIDELYGRIRYEQMVTTENAFERGMDAVAAVIAESGYHICGGSMSVNEYIKLVKDGFSKVSRGYDRPFGKRILRDKGIVYYNSAFGSLILKKPGNAWDSLLDDEEIFDVLSFLVDDDCRSVLKYLIESEKNTFTVEAVCRNCGIENRRAFEEKLIKSKMFHPLDLEVDDEEVRVYEFAVGRVKQFLTYAILLCAKESAVFLPTFSNFDSWDETFRF